MIDTTAIRSRSDAGIGRVVGYIPLGRVTVSQMAQGFQLAPDFIRKKTGFTSLARRGINEETSDLAVAALKRLAALDAAAIDRAGLLIVVTQNPDGFGLPHVSAKVAADMGLPPTLAAFDMSLGCSGWVYGVATALGFMDRNGITDALLVTADPYSKVIDPADRDTVMLFGDAATVTVLTSTSPRWHLGRCVFGTNGAKRSALEVGSNRKLYMNGRAIFEFSAIEVPKALEQALAMNRLSWDDVDRIYLHQASRYIVDTIGRRVGQTDKIPFLASDYGNAVSSSIPLLLESEQDADYRCVLTAGFGVGLSWAVAPLFATGA